MTPIEILHRLISVEGKQFEDWPNHWPVQESSGGGNCVLCNNWGTTRILARPLLEDHAPECPFRLAYDELKKTQNIIDEKEGA